MTGRPYISRLKIKTSEISKIFVRGKKSFHEIVLLGTAKQIDETMGKCSFSNQVTRNGKVGRCHLWTGHHTDSLNSFYHNRIFHESAKRTHQGAYRLRFFMNGI